MVSKQNEEDEVNTELDFDSVPAMIQAFAAKLGDEVGDKFTCYVYRVVRDEETGKVKRPFIKKYVGVEPDPLELAEKFRGGTYQMQFVWKPKSKQDKGRKSFTLDIDHEAFPIIPKSQNSSIPQLAGGGPVSESMALQLATIHEISDVMKAAYSSSGPGRGPVQSDPMEMFTGLMETMETGFARAMSIQSKIMERVFTRNMEKQYGLVEDVQPDQLVAGPEEGGIVGKYAPIVKDVVDGLKQVVGFFGENVPKDIVNKVKKDDRIKELLKDEKALLVIGQALRSEFGDNRASALMKLFGVQMVYKNPSPVAKTPEIGAAGARKPLNSSNGMKKDVPGIKGPVKGKEAVKVG